MDTYYKAWKDLGWFKASVFLMVFTVITSGPTAYISYKYGSNTITNEQSQLVNVNVNNATAAEDSGGKVAGKQTSCEEEAAFADNTFNWSYVGYTEPDKGGFYCVKESSPYLSPIIWSQYSLTPLFGSMTFEYLVRNSDESAPEAPSFIFALGENPKLSRFIVPEVGQRVVGFQHINIDDLEGEMKRASSTALTEAIKNNTHVRVTVRAQTIKANQISYRYNVNYIAASSGEAIEDVFSYDVTMPFPNPATIATSFGIGTFKGGCLRPVSYQICN
jgi:hypothetical protein